MNAPRVTTSALTPFGREFRKIRLEQSRRLYDVAVALGKSPSFISAIETGRKSLPAYFVDLVVQKLKLSQEQNKRLQEAADLSRDYVVVEARSPEARMLAAIFASKINLLTLQKIEEMLKHFEYSTRRNSDRLRKDRWVLPRGRIEIWQASNLVRFGFGYSPEQRIHIVELIELDLPKILPELVFEVVPDHEMEAGVLGLARLDPPRLVVSESVYLDAVKGGNGGRWILTHELGHIWLAHGSDTTFELSVSLVGRSMARIPALYSAEFQADEFAAELLMPAAICRSLSPREISMRFGVSDPTAQRRVSFIRRSGVHREVRRKHRRRGRRKSQLGGPVATIPQPPRQMEVSPEGKLPFGAEAAPRKFEIKDTKSDSGSGYANISKMDDRRFDSRRGTEFEQMLEALRFYGGFRKEP